MASTESGAIPFGLRHPTREQVGILARRLLEEADAAIRRSRPRAILMLVPYLLFYVLYAGLLGLALWGLGIHLSPPYFLALTAAAFASMAVLGKYYRSGELDVEGDMPRMLAVVVLQAVLLRALTWFFFVIPYLAFRNLTRLFPRRARVSPAVLETAAQLGVALDTAVTTRTLAALLPAATPGRALAEALVLLEWAGVAVTLPRGGDLVVQPGPSAGGLLAALPDRAEAVTLSMILAEPAAAELPEEEPEPAPSPAPAWLRPFVDRPGLGLAVLGGTAAALWILAALGLAWYRHLPVELAPSTLPNAGEASGLSEAGGKLAVCGAGVVDLFADLASAPEEKYSLKRLVRTDFRLRQVVRSEPPSLEGDFESEGSTAWDEPEEQEVRVSFGPVFAAFPDPGGRYLLVYGEWKCDTGQNTSCSGTGTAVVDLEKRTFRPEEQFGGWALKGWWEAGALLAVQPSRGWDQGGGGGVTSSNLAGTMAAIDPDTLQNRELYRSPHAFWGLAGVEQGRRVFLGADWKADETRLRAECTFTEYREFQKVGTFVLTVKQFRPFLYQARLDATGRYWILAFGALPGMMEMDQGVLYTVWIVSREGGRRAQVFESRRTAPYMINPFAYQGRSMFSMLLGDPPVLSINEIVR